MGANAQLLVVEAPDHLRLGTDKERLGGSPADGGARRSDEADRRNGAVERDHGGWIRLVPDVACKLAAGVESVQPAARIVRRQTVVLNQERETAAGVEPRGRPQKPAIEERAVAPQIGAGKKK